MAAVRTCAQHVRRAANARLGRASCRRRLRRGNDRSESVLWPLGMRLKRYSGAGVIQARRGRRRGSQHCGCALGREDKEMYRAEKIIGGERVGVGRWETDGWETDGA